MAKETFILQTNSCDKWVWPDVFLFGLSRKKSGEILFPVHTDFLWIKPCQHQMGWERSFVKVNCYIVKFDYYYCWFANTLELLFHMVENLKRYMKIIKFPIYADLMSLERGILYVLKHTRLSWHVEISPVILVRYLRNWSINSNAKQRQGAS